MRWMDLKGYRPPAEYLRRDEPEPEKKEEDFSLLDALSAGIGTAEEHFGALTGMENFANEGRAIKERNLHQYEDNSIPYHLQNIFVALPESAGIMAASTAAGIPLGGALGAAGGFARGALTQVPRVSGLLWDLAKAYQGAGTASKIARAVIPQNAKIATSAELGAAMEAGIEGYEAERRFIDLAKRNGTYVQGQTEQQARDVRDNVFWDNMGIISAFNLPQYNALMGRPARGLLGNVGRAVASGFGEGTEEVAQELASAYELGVTPQWRDIRDSFIAGGVLGTGMHGAGTAARYGYDRLTGAPTAEEIEEALNARKERLKEYSDRVGRVTVNDDGTAAYDNTPYGDIRQTVRDSAENSARQSVHGIDAFMRAIGGQESGGDYDAVNYDAGEMRGKYQIDVNNWAQWAQDAGLSPDAPMTPENQEIVARNKMLEYYNKFGNWRDVAIAWYAGEREVTNPRFDHDAPQGDNGEYPSVNAYADSVISRFQEQGGEESSGRARGGNVFGVENYAMPTQGDNITQQVSQLKDGWSDVIPQIGGVLKEKFGLNATISSAARSADHNAEVGGAPNSYHIVRDEGGDALDIVFDRDTTQEEQDRIADYFKGTGLFSEVLYHDVGSGAHLHLGGLKTENLSNGVQFDSRTLTRPSETRRTQHNQLSQEETPKPLFDLNAEDEQTQKLLERFASERVQSLANAENPDRSTLGFFTGLFNEAGEFQNTEANRAALRERYGNEITSWANEILKQESPAQPAAPARTQSSTPRQGAPKVTNEDILAAVDNFLERLRTDRTNPNTLLELQEARRAGDVAKMESILRQNNVEIAPVESTAPVAPSPQPPVQSENVVQNNQPPENILTSEQETAQPQQETNPATPKPTREQKQAQTHINRVSKATNLASKNRNALDNIINSIQWLAAQNNIVIPAEDLTKLKKRSLKTISKWRDRLTEAGALTVKSAQETTSAPPAPQQTAQPPAAETTATPKETPLQAALRRGREILGTQRQQEEQAQRQQEEQAIRERQEAAEAEVRRKSEESYRRIVQEKAEREQQEEERARQEKQNRELEALEARKAEERRNAEKREQIDEENRKRNKAHTLQTLLNIQDDDAQGVGDVTLALSEPPANQNERKNQGEAIKRLFENPEFQRVNSKVSNWGGLIKGLENGYTKAIRRAHQIFDDFVDTWEPNLESTEAEAPVSNEEAHARQVESERRSREQKKRMRENELAERQEVEKDEFAFDLQMEDDAFEDRANRQEALSDNADMILAEPSQDKTERIKQGQAILNLANNPLLGDATEKINRLAGLRGELEKGAFKAIRRAQEILRPYFNQSNPVENTATSSPKATPKRTGDMIEELATEPIAETIKDRQEQGKAILDLINSPEFQQEHKGFKLPKGVETALGIGSKNGIVAAQNTLGTLVTEESRMKEARARAPRVQSSQADEQVQQAQEDARQREKEQSRRASENAQQGLMEGTAESVQNQRNPEPREETQENVTRREQPAQEDDRDVFDLLPESNELNDVESAESTEQRPTRETPQPASQQETQPSTNKPAPTRKTPAEQREERAKNRTPKQQQPEGESESNVIKGEYGNEAEIESVTGVEHQVKHKVVEASDLITSHERDEGGYTVHENPNFPQELQPRDRETVSMTDALRRMIGHLIPKRFFQQALSANIGAPVVRKDGVILNGNGRTIAVIESYKEGKADNYKEALIDNAQKFGINPSKVAKMKQPILVREIVSDDLTLEQQQDIARDAEGGAKMGAREQAKADAKRISGKTLTGFNPNDIDLSASKLNDTTLELLTNVLRDILTGNEINAYTDAKGNISTDGITRAKNALFAYAYGSDELLTRSSEVSNDDNIRNVTAALMNAAPQVAIIRAGMQSGLLHNYNFNAIVEAVGKLSDLRKEGKAVKDFLRETQLAGMEFSNEARKILSFIDRNGRSAKRITEFFQNIAQGIQNQGNPQEGSLFGANEPVPFMDLIKTAIKKIEGGMDDLFAAPKEKSTTSKETSKQKDKTQPKADITGAPDIDTSNVVAEKDLTPAQKLLVSFGKKLGVEVVFFNNPDGRFRGVHKGGKTFLNINGNKELGGVFWHESFHWLKNNNPELYKALVKAAGITDAQRRAYLETSKRTDLKANEEIDEEILADMMNDVAKRTGLFQSVAGKNRGLIERVIQWFKDTLNKFIDHFRNPQGKLTTAQAQALASEFGRIANQLKDPNGNQIFRYNRRTHNVELANNRERTEAELSEMTAKNAHFEAKYSIDSNDNSTKSFKQRLKNLLGVEGKNIPIHKQMKRQLEDLSDMKIAADHLPEGVQVKIDKIAKVIRTGREYDWANILPEVGNAVAKQLGITQSAEMGNYIGKFILNGAPNDESAEAKEFAKAMRENTEMYNKVMAIRNTFNEWNNMSAEEQMIASTRYDKEIPPLKERAQKFWQYLRTELFDTQMPIHYHVAKFAKATGIKLSESINPEIAFRNLRGMQQRAMRMVYGNELTKEALQKMYPNVDFSNWKPIAMILESIKAEPGSQRYILFDQFVKACHFLDIHKHNDNVLTQQGKIRGEIRELRTELANADTKKKKAELERSIKKKEESLEALKQKIMDTPDAYTKDKCADLVSKYSDEFGEAQKDLVRYSRALLDIWVDSGMMDRRRYHQLLEAYPNYVPLHREFDENPNLNTADSMKQMLGSTKDVKDAIAAISNNTFDYIQRTEKNKAKLLLANLANFDGVGGIFELVDGSSPNDGTIIHFYENGKRKALQCSDEDIVKAVNSMNQPTMNLFLKVLQVPALMLRATATGLSPGFILGNFLRDPQDAFMVSKRYGAKSIKELPMDFITNPFITWKYVADAVHMSPLYEEYAVSGAAQSDFFSFDRDYKAEAIERLTKKNYKRFASPKGVIELLGKLGEWSELATRLRIYDKVKKSRAKEHGGINIYDDLVTAAFESRDFIDFARHGNAGRTWNTLTAFANPVLQGFDKQWRTYDLGQLKKFGGTEETQKNFRISVARLFLGGILPALVLSLLHKDDDWYKDDVQDWEKENYWILTETWRVPKGADVGLRFFSNLTEHLISSDPVRADKVLQPLKGILPDLMPTAFLPIFECMANYDLFRRQPIVPQREVNKFKDTPELQYDSTSSKLAVLLGRVTGVSPRYIDHVIYGYTSGFGKEATHLIDTVTPGRHAAWTRSDVPFFSRILRTPYRAPKIVSEYYEGFGRQESYAQRLAWEKKHGNPNAKPSAEYDPALHRRLKNIQRAMQNLNAAERAIMDDPKLTSEQVEEKREEIQKRRVELCRKAFQRAR